MEEQEHKYVCDRQSNLSEVQTVEEKDLWPVYDSEPSQSSIDSNSTTSSFNTGENLVFCGVSYQFNHILKLKGYSGLFFCYQGALRLNLLVVSVRTRQEVKMEAQGEICWIRLHPGLYIGYLMKWQLEMSLCANL